MTGQERFGRRSLKLAILSATGGDLNRELLEPAGLREAGSKVAELEQTGLSPKEALAEFAKRIRDARAWKGRRLEDWNDLSS